MPVTYTAPNSVSEIFLIVPEPAWPQDLVPFAYQKSHDICSRLKSFVASTCGFLHPQTRMGENASQTRYDPFAASGAAA